MRKNLAVLCIALLCSIFTYTNASAAPLFKDVDQMHSAKDELAFLAERGIISADPTVEFGVNEVITRIEAAEMIVKALELNGAEASDVTFTDVPPEYEGYDVVKAIVHAKIMQGGSDGKFRPHDQLTRGQMAVILVKAFELEGTSAYQFRDVPETFWAGSAIKTLFANGVTTGYEDNTYKPGTSLTKSNFSVFLARILNPDFKTTNACFDPVNTVKYAIRVPVTNVWHTPNQTRAIDAITISSKPDMGKWAKSLTVAQKNWLIGRTDTQALYGDTVDVLKESGNWLYIAVNDQYKTGQAKGYEGWVPKTHVKAYYPNYEKCKIAVVSSKIATLYNEPKSQRTSAFMEISYSTILNVVKEEKDWVHVQTKTDGVKYIRKADALVYTDFASIPKPIQKDLVNSAKQYLGLPYLWAGVSAYGYDCSGLIYAVYKNHGILIPRDSAVQAIHGKAVNRKDLQPGDLMFFAHNAGKGKVYHVSMYVGGGKMIHAPNSSRKVEIISIEAGIYKTNYAGARRYLK